MKKNSKSQNSKRQSLRQLLIYVVVVAVIATVMESIIQMAYFIQISLDITKVVNFIYKLKCIETPLYDSGVFIHW